jgi:hypothetical protein
MTGAGACSPQEPSIIIEDEAGAGAGGAVVEPAAVRNRTASKIPPSVSTKAPKLAHSSGERLSLQEDSTWLTDGLHEISRRAQDLFRVGDDGENGAAEEPPASLSMAIAEELVGAKEGLLLSRKSILTPEQRVSVQNGSADEVAQEVRDSSECQMQMRMREKDDLVAAEMMAAKAAKALEEAIAIAEAAAAEAAEAELARLDEELTRNLHASQQHHSPPSPDVDVRSSDLVGNATEKVLFDEKKLTKAGPPRRQFEPQKASNRGSTKLFV